MKKIFLFGDSFTYGHGCIKNGPGNDYIDNYQHEGDKPWFDIINENYNYEIINRGMGLFSNDKIIDSIISSYNDINPGDIVIIEMGFTNRFDIPNDEDDIFMTVAPNSKHLITNTHNWQRKKYTEFEFECIEYMTVMMDSILVKDRHQKRFDFFKKIIENKGVKKCVLWNILDYLNPDKYETILKATDGKIIDHHWSFKGHRSFADDILKILNEKRPLI